METAKTAGLRLIQARNTLGLSQREIGISSEVTQATISEMEKDKYLVSTKVLIGLKKHDISANWILFGDGDMFFSRSNDVVIRIDPKGKISVEK